MDARLAVGNLSDTTSDDDLRKLFTQAGVVASVAMLKDRETGLSTGKALVTMTTDDDTRKAIHMFNDFSLDERSMTVGLSRRRLAPNSGRPRRFQSGPRRRI
jgi:RNA recognition motif-containing protein